MVTGQVAKGCSAGKSLRGVAGLLWLAHDDRSRLVDAPARLTGLFGQVPRRAISGWARSVATLVRVELYHSLQVRATCSTHTNKYLRYKYLIYQLLMHQKKKF